MTDTMPSSMIGCTRVALSYTDFSRIRYWLSNTTIQVIRIGCQDHPIRGSVIRIQDTKIGCHDLLDYVSAKNAKQTNTFVGFSEYFTIPIRLYS